MWMFCLLLRILTATDPVAKKELDKMKKKELMLFLSHPSDNPWNAEEFIKTNKDLFLMMESFNIEF